MSLTLGEKLRQAREERSLSIAEVAEQTRISPLYLQSIENDDYKPLPGGIFNKGFVKSYAKFIGVDEQEALQDYARLQAQLEAANPNEFRSYRPEVLTDDHHASGSMIPTIIFAGIILALMTGGILFVVNYLQNQPDTPASNSTATANTDARPAAQPEPAAQPAQPNFDEIRLDFKATAEKISVTANIDGEQRTEEVAAGSTSRFVAKNALKLSYYRGFAEMVEISLNGKPVKAPAPPARGNAVTIDLNRDNVAAVWQSGELGPVPAETTAATPSPTATPEPTAAATPASSPDVTATPQRQATPVRTATPPRTTPTRSPAPLPTQRTIIVGRSPSPTPRATP